MKKEMFTTATVEAAFHNLKEYGANILPGLAALAKNKDVIIGKFKPLPNCFDGYCIRETPKAVIKILRKAYPNEDIRVFKYTVIICKGCKNEEHLLKCLGIGA